MQLGRHISEQFNIELESIRTHVLAMGGLVEQQLTLAMQAMLKDDAELANKVIRDDTKVNQMEVSIDEACTRIIAKRQPTAKDLRLVMAIIKSITDLERIGDVAMRIAEVAIKTQSIKELAFHASLESLGRQATIMLHQTLNAFARMDVEAAGQVYQHRDTIKEEYEALISQLTTHMMQTPSAIPNTLQVMWSAKSIKRIGDRCQNICEYLIYFVKGKDVRHLDKQELEQWIK